MLLCTFVVPLYSFLLCDLAWKVDALVRALVEPLGPAVFKLTLKLTFKLPVSTGGETTNVLRCETVGWAKPRDVVSMITKGVYFACGHVELLHI